ncbi:MAG TPA: D-alanyl-D-alanine carboxypeptidase, partial [Pyrinomonadaceae bacterium]|nr:D-alanyl-D-alanine carboxypeptidase [Pyrinomonadaceae bacterium]
MSQFLRKAFLIMSANVVAAGLAFSQSSPPVNTPAEVNRSQAAPIAGQTANTSTTTAVAQPAYLTPIGGFQGVLAETVEGLTIAAQSPDDRFNPASAVKLATALGALQSFGPEHRFMTGLWSTGTLDKSTGTLNGDLVVTGRDPSFHYEHAVMLARQLNDLGIRNVTGNLIVAPGFTMNFAWSAQRSGEDFLETLDSARRSGNATRAWLDERTLVGDTRSLTSVPSVV